MSESGACSERVTCLDGSLIYVHHVGETVELVVRGEPVTLDTQQASRLGRMLDPGSDTAEQADDPVAASEQVPRDREPAPESSADASPLEVPAPSEGCHRERIFDLVEDDGAHPSAPGRRSRRRERIFDLVEAGLLPPGSSLGFGRKGEVHEARVTAQGRLLADGREFDTPSAAAQHMAGSVSEPGWNVWRFDGRPLADLRWRLRAQGFPPGDRQYARSTRDEMQRLAARWVDHALAGGLDPGTSNREAVEDLLAGHYYAETTLASYRRHLRQWFAYWRSH